MKIFTKKVLDTDFPFTNDSGLEKDVIELYETFAKQRTQPFIVASGLLAESDTS